MFWKNQSRPKPPPIDQEQQFVGWLLRYGKEFGVYRRIYKRSIERYVEINMQSVLEELEKYPDRQALSDRLGHLSSFYVEEFLPFVEKSGGLQYLESKAQAHVAMLQIKIQVLFYILRYKYHDKVTTLMESICGPLEDLDFS